jgi:hypothetical protein
MKDRLRHPLRWTCDSGGNIHAVAGNIAGWCPWKTGDGEPQSASPWTAPTGFPSPLRATYPARLPARRPSVASTSAAPTASGSPSAKVRIAVSSVVCAAWAVEVPRFRAPRRGRRRPLSIHGSVSFLRPLAAAPATPSRQGRGSACSRSSQSIWITASAEGTVEDGRTSVRRQGTSGLDERALGRLDAKRSILREIWRRNRSARRRAHCTDPGLTHAQVTHMSGSRIGLPRAAARLSRHC